MTLTNTPQLFKFKLIVVSVNKLYLLSLKRDTKFLNLKSHRMKSFCEKVAPNRKFGVENFSSQSILNRKFKS